MNSIGQRLKDLRESSHLSQAEFAKIGGSSQASVAKTERGQIAPSLKLLVNLAEHFDVSMDYLCCRTDQPQGKLYECQPLMEATGQDMREFIEMCFDPASPFNSKLKETLIKMMEESKDGR